MFVVLSAFLGRGPIMHACITIHHIDHAGRQSPPPTVHYIVGMLFTCYTVHVSCHTDYHDCLSVSASVSVGFAVWGREH